MTKHAKQAVTEPISADLKKVMRQLKLSPMLDTLPERLALARHQHLSYAAFLELVLADEATRRDTSSAARRARAAGLDPAMPDMGGGLSRGQGEAAAVTVATAAASCGQMSVSGCRACRCRRVSV
ncbi:MAG: ATP-binding protein [Mycobacterium sp.]